MTDSHPQGSGAAQKPAPNFVLRYGLGMLAALLALAIRWPLWMVVGTTRPFLTFYPAIILSSWYCGFGPGVLTALCSALFVLFGIDHGEALTGQDLSLIHI